MITVDGNRIKVSQFDTCVVDLNLCNYKPYVDDFVEFTFNGNKMVLKYNEILKHNVFELDFPTNKKGIFKYTVVLVQRGVIRTELINNICEVI